MVAPMWRWASGKFEPYSVRMERAGFRLFAFFFSSRRRHTRFSRDWSSDVCSSDLGRLLEAASDLGANPLRTFWHVTLPLSLPGVVGGIVMVFIAAFGAYVTPKLLGGSSGIMFGNVLADQYSGTFNWPFGAVLALIMMSVVLVLLVVASRFARLDAVFGARA